ncbi:MAG: WXG100 family type VII secretion target [Clostridia bacterium]|nr:WXG100 family type VII secretion target [Clostridia bacterium]
MAIRVTPDELEAMASKLEGYAGQTTTLASELNSTVTGALSAWEGNAQKQYADRFAEFYPILSTQLPQLIRDMAADAKQRAARYREADA